MEARTILREMGGNGLYAGYENMLECVDLLLENPRKLLSLQKDVYAVVAKQHNTTVACMKRRLDILIDVLWRSASPEQWRVLGLGTLEKPSVGEFLEAMVWYIQTCEELENGYARRYRNAGTVIR